MASAAELRSRSRCLGTSSSRRSHSATKTGCCRACTSVCARARSQVWRAAGADVRRPGAHAKRGAAGARRPRQRSEPSSRRWARHSKPALGVQDIDVNTAVRVRRSWRRFPRCDCIFRSARGHIRGRTAGQHHPQPGRQSPSMGERPSRQTLGHGGGAPMPTFDKIHGRGARRNRAEDLDVDGLPRRRYRRAGADSRHLRSAARQVLLTGATGFLGRFICLEWLERLAAAGGQLICLVRAADRAAARRRLASSFDGGDPALERRFRRPGRRITSRSSSATSPRLGWASASPTFDRLARRGRPDRSPGRAGEPRTRHTKTSSAPTSPAPPSWSGWR